MNNLAQEAIELLNEVEDELCVLALQFNLPLNEQIFISQNISSIRTNLEKLKEKRNESTRRR